MPMLDEHVRADPRILRVYLEARRRYGQAGLCHHNFGHVVRDTHRALVIAASEKGVDYSVLLPAVLLHDIGFCYPNWPEMGHDLAGARLAQEMLPALGYLAFEVAAIQHCITAHKGKAEAPASLEAKILYDADVLEKAGLFDLVILGLLMCEFSENLADCLARECRDRAEETARGFFTAKAREMDRGRLVRVGALLNEMRQEVSGPRRDFSLSETDLWREPPKEVLGKS
ncbi:MAG: HD domain-containing protein [Desulfarculus sp.]|jgi:hypothetical protein|nr:MAG: HD domain-containing protein [Desulfarculus sp.]